MTQRDVALIIGAVILIVLLFGLLGGGMMMGWAGMGPWMMGYGHNGFYPLGWIVMLVVWAVIIGIIVLLAIWLFRQAAPALTPPASRPRALEILKERYARGELSREQYEEMKREIEESD